MSTNHDDDPWHIDATEFPVLGTMNEKLLFLLRYAILAPSSHNSQPWQFGLGNGYLELYADRRRALPVVDPHDRELVMSCGAALYFLKVAARRFGHVPEVELMPRGVGADLLARFSLGAEHPTSHEDRVLCDVILQRRTSRHRFDDTQLPASVVAAMETAARSEGAWLHEVAGDRRFAVAELVAEADRVQHRDADFRGELAAWLSTTAGRRDGMPGYAHQLSSFGGALAPLVVRTFDTGRGRAAADRELAQHVALLAVLGTPGDERADWLAAGQALGHVLLRATMSNVSVSFLNQAIEVPQLRAGLELALGLNGRAQMLLRLGYGPFDVKPTPRRPISEVLLR